MSNFTTYRQTPSKVQAWKNESIISSGIVAPIPPEILALGIFSTYTGDNIYHLTLPDTTVLDIPGGYWIIVASDSSVSVMSNTDFHNTYEL